MKNFYKNTLIILLTVLMLGGGALTANAHPPHSTSPGPNTCLLRVTVDANESRDLTGKNTGGHSRGSYLNIASRTSGGDHGIICMYGLVGWLTNALFFALLAIATLVIAYAAFLFVSAGGNESRVQKARKYLMLAIVGLIVAITARAIPNIVVGIIGIG
ncbi:MAG: hypothetical protein R3346_01460 [Candidatus Spechtbacterales bacterium]|nr:hypothetical protein [Candidatus Spechtbacterales bacterium]